MRRQSSVPVLKKRLWAVFSRFIRTRDLPLGCISCGRMIATIGQGQAGHYFSRGACPQPSMYFSEQNVHLQCPRCNLFCEGAKQGYRQGLIQRYGTRILEQLDVVRSLPHAPWTRWEYEAMIAVYTQKAKDLDHGRSAQPHG